MKNIILVLFSFFAIGCSSVAIPAPEKNYVPPAELNYRKYFHSNRNQLDTIEGVWTEFVVGSLYEDGKLISAIKSLNFVFSPIPEILSRLDYRDFLPLTLR